MTQGLMLGGFLVWMSLAAIADEPPPASTSASTTTPAAATETPAQTVSESAPATVEVSSPGNVTVDFKDADIQNVLRILAFKSGVNIVAGKDVTGNVTIRLVDVPWEKALDVILKTYGYAYDRQGNIIRVSTLENLRKEELSTEVFTLNYSHAADVEKSVKEMLSERGKVRSDSRSNMLVVTDMPTSLQSIRTVIGRLDAATPQVLIEAKVVELTLGEADKLGIDWNTHVVVNGSKRPTTFPWPARQRTDLSRFLPGGKEPVTSQTITPATFSGGVLVTAESSTTTVTASQDFPQTDTDLVNLTAGATNLQPTFPVAKATDFTFGTLDFSQLRATLDLIQSRQNTKLLSEPHVVVLNNQEAKILVGEIIAIPTYERNGTTGKMEITGYKDRDLGIRLSVTPQVNSEKEIVVTVHPEITNLLGYDALTPEIKVPHFTTREAQTNVRIQNGQTIAIGGLIREDTEDKKTKFPILGDIPLLDSIFSHHDKVTTKTDLLFFMTVTVVNDTAPPTGHKI